MPITRTVTTRTIPGYHTTRIIATRTVAPITRPSRRWSGRRRPGGRRGRVHRGVGSGVAP